MDYIYKISLERIIDGDTVVLNIDLGFDVWVKVKTRLYGIDTPETYGVKKESAEYAAGIAAKNFVAKWFEENNDNDLYIQSYNNKKVKQGKYGRWLVEIFSYNNNEKEILNNLLVENNYAKVI